MCRTPARIALAISGRAALSVSQFSQPIHSVHSAISMRPPWAMRISPASPLAGLLAKPDVVSEVPHSVPKRILLMGAASRRSRLI